MRRNFRENLPFNLKHTLHYRSRGSKPITTREPLTRAHEEADVNKMETDKGQARVSVYSKLVQQVAVIILYIAETKIGYRSMDDKTVRRWFGLR